MDDDAFEVYPCLVDGAPASIYVNLRFEEAHPASDTRYTIAIALRAPGEHGIGTADEAEAVNLVEEAVIARAKELAITYVGRIRTRGVWEIVLYGFDGHRDELAALVGDRRVDNRSARDDAWTYYRELLLPDAERRQWIDDRRMVQVFSELGDRLATPRRVEHRVAFASDEARDKFAAEIAAAGFVVEPAADHRALVHRDDPIELDHIHDVVMILVDAAARHGGHYDRWHAIPAG